MSEITLLSFMETGVSEKERKISTWKDSLIKEESWRLENNHGGNTQHIELLKGEFMENLNKIVALVEGCIEDKENKREDTPRLRDLYSYCENLSHNRHTAFVFETLTGVKVGKTNKSGLSAFVSFFGNAIPRDIEEQARRHKAFREAAVLEEKRKKEEEKRSYFSSPIWDKELTGKLTPVQYGRIEKILEKLWRFDGKIETLKENLESEEIAGKKITDNEHKWNRRKWNRMTGDEQRAYEAKLRKGRTHWVCFSDDTFREIPKMVYDILNVHGVSEV